MNYRYIGKLEPYIYIYTMIDLPYGFYPASMD